MSVLRADRAGLRVGLIALLALALAGPEATCVAPPEPLPIVTVTVNGIPGDRNGLLVVPPSGFVVNVDVSPPDPENVISAGVEAWGSAAFQVVPLTLAPDGSGGVGVVPGPLAVGTWNVTGLAGKTAGKFVRDRLAVAVRDFPAGSAPIGTGQKIWLDFAADRDAVPGPDFAVDLQAFGLGSPADPALSAVVEGRVIQAVLDAVADVYHGQDPAGLGAPDPIRVDFHATDPGPGDVTVVCVGGEDPSGGATIGSILIDPNNAARSSVECATIPPTGIFPRELLVLAGEASFQQTFDPLRPAAGGTPVGEHPLDPIVLAPGFDPATATAAERARHDEIDLSVVRFGDALGTIIAHETGHALGLVPPGAPGTGLFGGSVGAEFVHNVEPGGAIPTANLVMNPGSTYTFSKLAGLEGQPFPVFRPMNHAYLRDRLVIDAAVTELVVGPTAIAAGPTVITAGQTVLLTVSGADFRPTPALRLESPGFGYDLLNEAFVSGAQVTGWVVSSQVLPGLYDVVVTNPDGQQATLPAAVEIQ